ncbi:hypothetical protein ONZ43_g7590 [Nemania bipapillata]|uniref:Uncharacterized protein n=1 Tax=Nemania bipapillata TaxID=110536 RepID=A0ACC2HPP7_9PEZI|nr:hypothetical protein ONZ43_g7590 [Nemania bipapillata]
MNADSYSARALGSPQPTGWLADQLQMADLAHLATTLLATIDEIEVNVATVATVAIDVTEDAVDHRDAPTATRMRMRQAGAIETVSVKTDMGALVGIVESENGTAIGAVPPRT